MLCTKARATSAGSTPTSAARGGGGGGGGAGNARAINAYDEYGIPQSTNMGRFQYTGQAWMPTLGMYNFKARIYSPTLGRFLQTDPIGYKDGLNWYEYVKDDPVNRTDPAGTQGLFDNLVSWGKMVAGDVASLGKGLAHGEVGWALGGLPPDLGGAVAGFAGTSFRAAISEVRVETQASQGLSPQARGIASEARVLKGMGLEENTQAVATEEGKSVPDALNSQVSVEIKDSARVSATSQVRIQTDAATASGRQSVLVTGTNTQVTAPAARRFDQIIKRDDLGPKND